MRWITVLLCFGLAACAWSETEPLSPSNPPEASKVTAQARDIAKEAKLPEPLEISSPRAGHPLSPGPWLVCLRSTAPDHPQRYAIFFRDNDRVGYRMAVVIDGCGQENFEPLK